MTLECNQVWKDDAGFMVRITGVDRDPSGWIKSVTYDEVYNMSFDDDAFGKRGIVVPGPYWAGWARRMTCLPGKESKR